MTINSTHRQAIDSVANVLIIGGLWLLYAVVRGLTTDTQPAALGTTAQLLDIEAANSYYLLHFPLTLAVLAVAFWRGRSTVFAVMRNSAVFCTTRPADQLGDIMACTLERILTNR